jgi:hypothetical protein
MPAADGHESYLQQIKLATDRLFAARRQLLFFWRSSHWNGCNDWQKSPALCIKRTNNIAYKNKAVNP